MIAPTSLLSIWHCTSLLQSQLVHLLLNPCSATHQLGDAGQITHLCSSVFSDNISMYLIGLTWHISTFLRRLVIYITKRPWGLNELTFAKFLEKGLISRSSKIKIFKCALLPCHLYRTKIWAWMMKNIVTKSSKLT